MKTKAFYNMDQAAMYMSGTVVTYKDDPVYIAQVSGDREGRLLFYCQPLYNDPNNPLDLSPVRSDDENLDFTPVKLGYINITKFGITSTYKSFRVPQRQFKIGLTGNNLKLLPAVGRKKSVMLSKFMYDTIKGNYPSFEDAVKSYEEERGGMAFSRKFAVSSTGKLNYLNLKQPIGKVVGNDIDLFPNYMYLSQKLEKDVLR